MSINDIISIIVPIYNSEKYLKLCIDSIINQTYLNIEILLINDGSTDSSYEICKEYEKNDKRIKVFSKNNTGVSDTRNYGINMAKGKYILFVDSDDWIELDMCEYLINIMLSSNSDISICDYFIGNNNSNKQENIEYYYGEEIIYHYLDDIDHMGSIWNKLYKKEIISDKRFEINKNVGEDILFNCKIFLEAEKVVVSNICKYHYNCESESITRSKLTLKKIMDNIQNHESQIELIKEKHPNSIEMHYKAITNYLNTLISIYICSDQKIEKDANIELIMAIKKNYNSYYNDKNIKKSIITKLWLILKLRSFFKIIFNYYIKLKNLKEEK